MPTPTAPAIPPRLQSAISGRYAVARELGRGGMAVVYLARDLKHDRPVAIKVLRPDLGSLLGPERFQREIRIAAQLQHPNILPVYDSGTEDGVLWFTMPYVEGDTLRKRLRHRGRVPVGEAVPVLEDIARALAYAHRRGVIHRDVKPENVMVGDDYMLLADFGVARVLDATRRTANTDDEARQRARQIWHSINEPNLLQNIRPTRSRASLVLRKSADHTVSSVLLRKL